VAVDGATVCHNRPRGSGQSDHAGLNQA